MFCESLGNECNKQNKLQITLPNQEKPDNETVVLWKHQIQNALLQKSINQLSHHVR